MCHLVPMDGQELELQSLAVDAVVLNYLRPGNEALARQLVAGETAVLVLDTEGGVFSSIDRYGQVLSQDTELRGLMAAWLSWGPRLAEHGVAHRWFQPDQVVVTGSPRFDFYVEPWRQAALEVAPIRPQDPMVLVNGNFPVANPRFQTPAKEVTTLVRRFGFDPDHVARWQATQAKTMRQLAEATNRSARNNPDLLFAYRPHPFERLDGYNGLLERLPNIILRKDGGVDGWILQSRAIVQRGCTTAIEAGLAGVPAFSPTWISIFEDMPSVEAVSIPCPTGEFMDEQIRASVSGLSGTPTDQWNALRSIIEDWFLTIDGCSHKRVARAVLARSTAGDRHRRARQLVNSTCGQRLRASLKGSVPPSLWRLRPGRREPVWQPSEKSFSVDQVAILVGAICRATDRSPLDVEPSLAHQIRPYRFARSVAVRAARV